MDARTALRIALIRQAVISWRPDVNKQIQEAIELKRIKTSLEATITIDAPHVLVALFREAGIDESDLAELFKVSFVWLRLTTI